MFLATALLYPCVLAVLCLGAGLLVEVLSGSRVPAALLLPTGIAALIGVSQLTTLVAAIAPATPYLAAAVALVGLVLARERASALLGAAVRRPLLPLVSMLAYALCLAPVLLSGRASFSSFMALSDSAVHLIGADYLIHHGQSYGHLDLATSYGRFINAYYGTNYPSGADTLFGASALLLGLPLIWSFQPFNAFVLASACGPAWLLARRLGLRGAWAAPAALTAVVPALVYGYELIGSIKELTALTLLLAAGCFVVGARRWLGRGRGGALALALVLAAGISALGAAFGVWALASLVALVPTLVRLLRRGLRAGTVAAQALVGVGAGLLAALPTWLHLGGSLQVAQNIASTSNSGNLHAPLHVAQVLGVWLEESYKLMPTGRDGTLTDVLVGLALTCAVLGAVQCVRRRAWELASWIAAVLLASLIVSRLVTTWAEAKTLVLSSPVVVLLAWGGVALLRELPPRALGAALAAAVAVALLAGVIVSDALQYRASNLAPTARYEELASIDKRFAGRGPVLFTDFDEYSMYVLRDVDVGGPNFVYPPPALAGAAAGYGYPVRLDAVAPAALRAYPLIVTRRDPAAARPPAAYALAWQGAYYEVWRRTADAPAAIVHDAATGDAAAQCHTLAALAAQAPAGTRLVAARKPRLARVALAALRLPPGWGHVRSGLAMGRAGSVTAPFSLPASGNWLLWVQGQFMPRVTLAVDGRTATAPAGEISGNSLVVASPPPPSLALARGEHVLSVTRGAPGLRPGGRGAAVLAAAFLTPARASTATLHTVPAAAWRSLCGGDYEWFELTS